MIFAWARCSPHSPPPSRSRVSLCRTLSIVCALMLMACASPEEKASKNVMRGDEQVQERNYAYAEHYYGLAITNMPEFAEAHGKRGWVRLRLLSNEEALVDAERAVELDPNVAAYSATLGRAACNLEQWSKCADALTKSLEMDPEQPRLALVLGRALSEQGEHTKAVESFEMALDAGFWRGGEGLVTSLIALSRHDEARVALAKARTASRGDATAASLFDALEAQLPAAAPAPTSPDAPTTPLPELQDDGVVPSEETAPSDNAE